MAEHVVPGGKEVVVSLSDGREVIIILLYGAIYCQNLHSGVTYQPLFELLFSLLASSVNPEMLSTSKF